MKHSLKRFHFLFCLVNFTVNQDLKLTYLGYFIFNFLYKLLSNLLEKVHFSLLSLNSDFKFKNSLSKAILHSCCFFTELFLLVTQNCQLLVQLSGNINQGKMLLLCTIVKIGCLFLLFANVKYLIFHKFYLLKLLLAISILF